MRVKIETELPIDTVRVGNVYQVRGGYGAKAGHVMVIVGLFEGEISHCYRRTASCLILSKEGEIVGATSYGIHYFEEKAPIAFIDGLEEMELVMRSL